MSGAGSVPTRVALASDQRLVLEAVAAALASRGLDVVVVSWTSGPRDEPLGRQVDAAEPAVAVLLYDVDMTLRMALARAAVRAWPGPWVILTDSPPGPVWGGLLNAGAVAVMSRDVDLIRLDRLLRRVAAGGVPPGQAARDRYVAAWLAVQEQHDQVQERIDSLAPRQRDVLELLRRGVRVVDIADRWGLAEATIRTQVREVLRKLGVRSQLAAVALLRAVDETAKRPPTRH